MLCLPITRKNWKKPCSNANTNVETTGDLLRLRRRHQSHLLRPLDVSGNPAEPRLCDSTLAHAAGNGHYVPASKQVELLRIGNGLPRSGEVTIGSRRLNRADKENRG